MCLMIGMTTPFAMLRRLRPLALQRGLRGNLTNDGVRTYTYECAAYLKRSGRDAADRLIAVSGPPLAVGYTYNGDGLLVSQNIDGAPTTFAWDVAAELPQVLAASNGASYLYGLGLLGQQQGGAWQFPLADGLGSVRQLVDPAASVTLAQSFDPFGVPLSPSGGQPFGYAGEQWDANTSLIYLRARWYNPSLGRFLTRDPIPGPPSSPATLNPYAYGRNNPALYVDPSGKFFFIPLLLVGLAGGALGGLGYYSIQSCMHPDPCGRRDWDWNQALLWGTVGTALGGMIGTAIYGGWWVGTQVGWWGATSSIWTLPPLERGIEAEKIIGRSPFLVQNFPKIDRFVNGVATSIKSIDLNAASYQNIGNLTRTVNGYIETMSRYQGQPTLWGGVRILPNQITGRAVDLAIPASGVTQAQLAALQALQQTASKLGNTGVTLNIIPIP